MRLSSQPPTVPALRNGQPGIPGSLSRHWLPVALLASLCLTAAAEPQLSSWYTEQSGKYARIFTSKENEAAGTTSTTWSRGQGNQTSPTYAGVHEIHHDANWIYIRTSGLGFHVMGPWYLNEAKTQNFPSFPGNTATTYRIPRTPSAFNGNTTTGFGSIGYFVDGVALFDATDTFSYINSRGSDGSPVGGERGDGVWNRDAYVNEGVTFDAANAHQAMNLHHYHANAPAIRHLLGDSVDYDTGANVYTESFNGTHSPILGWMSDGHPVYGPYAYSDPDDPGSTVRRMTSGYQKRDGSNASTNLNTTGRTTLPQWANQLQGRTTTLATNRYGPNVSTTYILGHYLEDYAYMGDLGPKQGTDFDLDEYNGRFCVTPEFPEGVWAYFTTIEADGTPVFPYNIGRNFYGTPSGGNTNSIPATATRTFIGGPSKQHSARDTDRGDGVITLTWDTVEGASYRVEQGADLENWDGEDAGFTAESITQTTSDTPNPATQPTQFYRLRRTGIASYDDSGFDNQFEDGDEGLLPGLTPGTSSTIEVASARDVTLETVVIVPEAEASAVVILLEGGDGKITINETPEGSIIESNGFLARNAVLFSEQGLIVAVVDVPSDFAAEGIDVPYRTSADQATDVEAVVDWIAERTSLPIWIIGMSLGTYSATNSAIRLAGKLDGYAVCSASTAPVGIAGMLMPTGILELEMGQITVPSIVIGHVDDSCPGTPSSGVADVVDALVNAESVVSNVFTGGLDAVSPPCGPLSPHGYYGIDAIVVAFMAESIK